MHLAKEVELFVNLAKLLLKLYNVFLRMRLQIFKLILGLIQSVLLIRLPSLIIF